MPQEGAPVGQSARDCRRRRACRHRGAASSRVRNSRRNSAPSTRTGRRKAGRDDIQRLPSSDDAAARHDHVDVRVVGHRRAPGVQHGGDADAGAEMLRIGGDGQHRLGRRLEQQVVDHRLVVKAMAAISAGSVNTTWK